jgi:hypothetical protein
MKRHTRLASFLLMCLVLIGLNVVATINGLYTFEPVANDKPAVSLYTENIAAMSIYP